MLRLRLVPALAASLLALALAPRDAAAQSCPLPPVAVAGADVARCVATTGFSDFVLNGERSLPTPGGGTIARYCWSTDWGTFLESGQAVSCSALPTATLRAPHAAGITVVHARLTVTDTLGCDGTDDLEIRLATAASITRASVSLPQSCLGETLDFLGSAVSPFGATSLVEHRWDVDITVDADADGDPANDADLVRTAVSGRQAVASFVPRGIGTFTARLTAIVEPSPCRATQDVTYSVASAPEVTITVSDSSACAGASARFEARQGAGVAATLTWDFDIAQDADGDGNPSNDTQATGNVVSHAWPDAGLHRYRVTATTAGGCASVAERNFLVRAAPVPAFTTLGPSCNVLTMSFFDASSGTGSLLSSWDFGDGTGTFGGTALNHTYARPGAYLVRHSVVDESGCSATESRLVEVTAGAFSIEGVAMLDGQEGSGTSGNADGYLQPGERVRFVVTARNSASLEATSVAARLESLSGTTLTVSDADATIGNLPAGATGSTAAPHLEAVVSPSAACGTQVSVAVTLSGNAGGTCSVTQVLTYQVGAPQLQVGAGGLDLAGTTLSTYGADATFGGGAHVVVMVERDLGGGNASPRVRLTRATTDGVRLDDAAWIDDAAEFVRWPRIAWSADSQRFLAAWQAEGTTRGARFRLLDATGRPLAPSARFDAGGTVSAVDVAWSGDHWLVAWAERPAAGGGSQAWVRAVTADGVAVGSPAALGAPSNVDLFVRAAGNGTRVALAISALASDDAGAPSPVLQVIEGVPPRVTLAVGLGDALDARADVTPMGAGFLACTGEAPGHDAVELVLVDAEGRTTRSVATTGGGNALLGSSGDVAVLAYWSAFGEGTHWAQLVSPAGVPLGEPAQLPAAAEVLALSGSGDGRTLAVTLDGQAIAVEGQLLEAGLPESCTEGVPGDVAPAPNGNGAVDVGDVVLVLRASVGLEPVTTLLLDRGDVAPGTREGSVHRVVGDNRIDVNDAVILLQAATGLITIVAD